MGYAQLDDGFWNSKKLHALSDRAHRLYVRAISYSSSAVTDGIIDTADMAALGCSPSTRGVVNASVAELVAAGLWEPVGDEYRIHDYLKHNTSKRQRTEKARASANARWHPESPPDDAPSNAIASAPHMQNNAKATHIATHRIAHTNGTASLDLPVGEPVCAFPMALEKAEKMKRGRPSAVESERLLSWCDEFSEPTVIAAIEMHGSYATSLTPVKNTLDSWGPGGQPKPKPGDPGAYNGGPGGSFEDRKARYEVPEWAQPEKENDEK